MAIEVKHIKPGDPEFDEIAAKVTPLNRIRRGYLEVNNYISAETVPVPLSRRLETID